LIEPTLVLIHDDLANFPEHRLNFFTLLNSMVH